MELEELKWKLKDLGCKNFEYYKFLCGNPSYRFNYKRSRYCVIYHKEEQYWRYELLKKSGNQWVNTFRNTQEVIDFIKNL